MGVFSYVHELTSTIPPPRLFKAISFETDNIMIKVAPHVVKKAEVLEGDGGAGTVTRVTFAEGGRFNWVKNRTDSIDNENLIFCYSLIEGEVLTDYLEKISFELKLGASPDGGSTVKSTATYYTKGDHEVEEAIVKEGKDRISMKFKAIEGFLIANPDTYN